MSHIQTLLYLSQQRHALKEGFDGKGRNGSEYTIKLTIIICKNNNVERKQLTRFPSFVISFFLEGKKERRKDEGKGRKMGRRNDDMKNAEALENQ